MDAELSRESERPGLLGLPDEPLVVTEVGHHHVDGSDAPKSGGLGDLCSGGLYLEVVRASHTTKVGHIVLGAEVAPADPGMRGDRPGIHDAGHRLESGDDRKVGVTCGVEGSHHGVHVGCRCQLRDDHTGEALGQSIQYVVDEVDGVGCVHPHEEADLGCERRCHLVGDCPGLDLAVRWDGILEVDYSSAGAGPGQLG